VPSFGFISKLADQIGKYGNYENFDLAINKTGEKTSPYEVRNASKLKSADCLDELLNDDGSEVIGASIVVGPLTKEELSYERYDLKKLYQPTSYQSLRKRLASVFKLCDATIGTKFWDELDSLATEERARYDALKETAEASQEKTETAAVKEALSSDEKAPEQAPEEPKPSKRQLPQSEKVRIGPAVLLSDEKIALLKGWKGLSDKEKSQIKDVVVEDGKVKTIIYTDDVKDDDMLECTDCGILSPASFEHVCPKCGIAF
jgi:hypothetical protein